MASMSQLADDFFTCTLCVEKFREPKTLPCLHTFCKSCLGLYIRQTINKEVFMCPLCGQETRSEVSGLSVEQWMETFVSNKFISSLLKVTETRQSEKACDICKQEHILVDAASWCKECLEAICEDCERVHGRSRASRDHHVVSIEYLENEALDRLLRPKQGSLPCPHHKGKLLSLVCTSCKTFVCETCIAVGHGSCKKIESAEKVVNDLKSDINKSKEATKNLKDAAYGETRKYQDRMEILTKSRDACLEEIAEHVKQLVDLLYEKQQKLASETETAYKKQRENLAERVLNGEVRVNSLTKTEKFLDQLLLYGSEADILNNYNSISKQVQLLQKQLSSVNKRDNSIHMNFDPDKKSLESVKSAITIGEIKVLQGNKAIKVASLPQKPSPPNVQKQINSKVNTSPRRTPASVRGTPKTRLLASFSGRTGNDMIKTDLRGILLLRSGDVVIMDVHFRNKHLKKFTPRGKLVSETDVGECPHSIALVSHTEAVVTLPKSKEFAFITVGGTLHLTGKIKTQKSYFSLATSADDVIATFGLSPPGPPSIDVISCSGVILHTVELDGKLNRPPLGITLPPSGDILILTEDKLTCVNMSGCCLYVFQTAKSRDIKSPVAVTTDTQGRTLLVDKVASKIHVISGDGIHQGELLTRRDGIREPLAATVGDSGVLALTQSNGDTKLFAIKQLIP